MLRRRFTPTQRWRSLTTLHTTLRNLRRFRQQKINTLMLERHIVATIKQLINQVMWCGCEQRKPHLTNFPHFSTQVHSKLWWSKSNSIHDITKNLYQKGRLKLISTLKDTCEQIIRDKNKKKYQESCSRNKKQTPS